jgi:hypothetical protein
VNFALGFGLLSNASIWTDRRFLNNKKLWNPKEEQAWVHDRFDGMNLHDFRGDNVSSILCQKIM